MLKLLGPLAGVIFALFIGAVIVGVMYYSYHALGLVFPGDLLGQIFGMVLFDISAINWFLVFVKRCESTMQYVFSILGFLIGLSGTLGLVGIEVGLSSGYIVPGTMQQQLTYIFVGVMIGHLVLIYAHHAAAPEVSKDISQGVEVAKIVDQAQRDAAKMISERVRTISEPLALEMVREVLRGLNLEPRENGVLELTALDVESPGEKQSPGGAASFLSKILSGWGNGARKYGSNVPSVALSSQPQTKKPSPAAENAGLEDGDASTPKK